MRFTKASVAALQLPDGKRDHVEWDDELPGFGVRIRAGGSRTWRIQYRFGSRQRSESLGDIRKVGLEDARKIARQRFAQVELGVDPGAQRSASAVAAALTLARAVERYLADKRDTLRPSTYKASERYFAVHWAPLRSHPIGAITRSVVAARLQEIIRAHGRTSAARARGVLSALFGWAMREGLAESNPVVLTNDPAAGIRPRERVLDDAELTAVWNACPSDDFGAIVKLLILTGCRREEIGALMHEEVNFATGVATIPGTRTKNHRELQLPLPAVALEILRSVPRREGRDYVFGTRGGSFSAWSYSTVKLNARIIEAMGRSLPPWALHDLRRTMRTGLGRLGVAPHIAEMCINHVKGGVQAVYDRYSYQGEMKVALARWSEHVLAIVEGRESKVVSLQRI